MKKCYVVLACASLFAACQPKPATETVASSPSPDYPYKIKNPDNWMIDTSHANTMTALNALKAYETKDTVLMKKCIGDSITFSYDGGVFKGTNAQFVKMAATMSTGITTKIKVDDWEAVVGKDVKKHEWVSIWYTQYNTDMKGKKDSVEYLNDMLIKNGKIIKLDEYARHFKMPGK